ncbi:hypothetical protein J1N35_030993 [Gossypium stocksii]|uniref:Uncharacterized protein n=1 Tax=Gossypium stocksii TaxID=47602 RepID=A0A9D3ZTC1_9ROSI|nr:hypothetical protein J1N35_030993 [Gossypium stocksii]
MIGGLQFRVSASSSILFNWVEPATNPSEACSPCCSADTRKGRGGDANVAESKGLSLMPLITKTMVPAAEARQANCVKVTSYEEGSTPEDENLLAFLFHSKCTSLESVYKAKEKQKLKDLFLIYLFVDDSKHKKSISLVRTFSCHVAMLIMFLLFLFISIKCSHGLWEYE